MRYENEEQLLKIIKITPPIFIIVISLLITLFVFFENKKTFEGAKNKIYLEYVKHNKQVIKDQVNSAYRYILTEQKLTEDNLKQSLSQQVMIAHTIATSIYEKNKDKSTTKVKKLIIDALREIRFNNGRGYFFIYDLDHRNIMLPTSSNLENKNFINHQDAKGKFIIRDMVSIHKKYNEGFHEWYWYKPNDNKLQYKKIGFTKKFKPFNWFIGTGEYIKDFEIELKKKVLKHMSQIKYNNGNGYIFIVDYDSVYLTHLRKEYIGKKAIANNDTKDVGIVINKLIDFAKNGNGYHSYTQNKKPGTNISTKKTSYVQGVNSWGWMIGAGFYEDDLNELVSHMKKELDEKFVEYIRGILLTALLLTIFFLSLSFYITKILQKKFLKYRDEIKKHLYENSKQQEVLAQQSKMASMGEMLENIAHQWRQPLSAITSLASGMKLEKEFGVSTLKEEFVKLDTIVSSANHLSQTIDDFRDFFKPNKKKVLSNLPLTFNKTFAIFKSKLENEKIQLKKNIEFVEFEYLENELIQVLINIISNAIDALENQDIKYKVIFIDIKKLNNKAIIKIKDNGKGINPKIIHRVFEPYFTTKYKAEGTGIGLYMSSEIITKHMEGYIFAHNIEFKYNEIDFKGAEFVITLPLS